MKTNISVLRAVAWTELIRLRRSPFRCVALLVYLAVGLAAIEVGQVHVESLRSSLAEGDERQQSQRAEALAWFDEGRVGPEDRPWVDITEPLWVDWYSANHLGLEVAPLAGVSVGVSDVRGNLVRLSRFATPFDADEWRQLANPELQLLGVMDLSFVLSFLLPLLVIVLVFDLRGYERDRGIEGLIVLQAGRVGSWFGARLAVAAAVAALPTLLLWIVAGWRTGALVDQTAGWWIGGLLTALYLLLWVGLGGVAAARCGSANRAALVLASSWIGFCVLLPALANQVVNAREPIGYSTQIIDAVRADRYEMYEAPVESLLPALYESFPALAQHAYADQEERDSLKDRHVYDFASHQLVREAYDVVAASERRRLQTAERFLLANPVQAYQVGLNQLAGTEASAYLTLGQAILDAVRLKLERILKLAWTSEPIGRDEFLAYAEGVPSRVKAAAVPTSPVWGALVTWALGALVLSNRVRIRR